MVTSLLSVLSVFEISMYIVDHGSFSDIVNMPVTADLLAPAVILATVVRLIWVIFQ